MEDHKHVIGVIASPAGLMLAYRRDEGLMREYGGMDFPYCPICGKPNTVAKAKTVEFDDGEAYCVGDKWYSGRL